VPSLVRAPTGDVPARRLHTAYHIGAALPEAHRLGRCRIMRVTQGEPESRTYQHRLNPVSR